MMNLAQATTEVGTAAMLAWTWAAEFLPRLGGALLILFIAFTAANWAGRGIGTALGKSGRIDITIRPVIVAIVRYTIMVLAFVAVLGQLGVQTASVLAVLGAAGLAIGLALQGTLANIAAGLMLLWLRPFHAGESIEAGGVTGRVQEVGLFATRLETGDGIYRFVPNAELWPKPISNFTRNPVRQVEIKAVLNHRADIDQARQIAMTAVEADKRIRPSPAPQAVVEGFTEKGVLFIVRAWADTADHAGVLRQMTETMQKRFAEAGIEFGK